MDLDLERGFVLRGDEAVKYLEAVAKDHTMAVMNGEEDSEGMTEVLDDLAFMKKDITKHDYEYVKFIECPMSASGINVIPMIEKE